MPEKQLYEYAVVRVVPRVEREEFVNAGIILYCRDLRFLGTMITLDEDRVNALCSTIDMADLREHLQAFQHIAEGRSDCGAISRLDHASRFRWLTATRSTIIQASKVHPGLTTDPQSTLVKLHHALVL